MARTVEQLLSETVERLPTTAEKIASAVLTKQSSGFPVYTRFPYGIRRSYGFGQPQGNFYGQQQPQQPQVPRTEYGVPVLGHGAMDPETLDAQHTYHQHQLIQHGLQRGYTKDQVNRQLDALQKRYETQRTRLQAFNNLLESRRQASGQNAAQNKPDGASAPKVDIQGATRDYDAFSKQYQAFEAKKKELLANLDARNVKPGHSGSEKDPEAKQYLDLVAKQKQFLGNVKNYFTSKGPAHAAVFKANSEVADTRQKLKQLTDDGSPDFGEIQRLQERLATLENDAQLMQTDPAKFVQNYGSGPAFAGAVSAEGPGASKVPVDSGLLGARQTGPSPTNIPNPQPGGQPQQTPATPLPEESVAPAAEPTVPAQQPANYFGNATGQALVPSPPVAPPKSQKDLRIARNQHMVEHGFGMPGSTFPVVGSSLAFSGSGAATKQPTMIDTGRDAITGLANQAVGIRDQAARNIGGAVAGRVSTFANNVARPFQSWFPRQPEAQLGPVQQTPASNGILGQANQSALRPTGRGDSGVASIGSAGTQSEPSYNPRKFQESLQREQGMNAQQAADFTPSPGVAKSPGRAPAGAITGRQTNTKPLDMTKGGSSAAVGSDSISRIAKLAFSAGYPGFGQQAYGLDNYPGYHQGGQGTQFADYPTGYSNRTSTQAQNPLGGLDRKVLDLQLRWLRDGDQQAKTELDAITQRLNQQTGVSNAKGKSQFYQNAIGSDGSLAGPGVTGSTGDTDEISPDDIERYQLAASGLTSGEAELNKQLEALKNSNVDSDEYRSAASYLEDRQQERDSILSGFKQHHQAFSNAAGNYDPANTSMLGGLGQILGMASRNLGTSDLGSGYSETLNAHNDLKKWLAHNKEKIPPTILADLQKRYGHYVTGSNELLHRVRDESSDAAAEALRKHYDVRVSAAKARADQIKEQYRKDQEQKLRAEWQARQSKMLADKARIEAKYKSIFNDPLKRQRFGAAPYATSPANQATIPTQTATPPTKQPMAPTPPTKQPASATGQTISGQAAAPPQVILAPDTPFVPNRAGNYDDETGVETLTGPTREGSSSRDIASDVLSRMMTAVTKKAAVSVPALAAMAAMSGNQTIVLPGPKKKKKKPPVEEELPVEKVVDLLKDLRKPRKVR